MRAWVIIGVLILGMAHPGPKQQSAAHKDEQERKQAPARPIVVPSTSTSEGQPAAEVKKAGPTQKTENTWKRVFAPEYSSNWALVLVGIGATCVALWTLKVIARQAVSMRRQTTILRSSAQAAKLNAEALIGSERAWIIVETTSPPALQSQPPAGPVLTMWFAFRLANNGRTVARITKAQFRFHAVTELPAVPDYNSVADTTEALGILPAQARFQYVVRFEDGMPTEEQVAAIRDGRLTLCVYGCIQYLDFADKPRKSQFCYVYKIPRGFVTVGINDTERFDVDGPPAYNEYT